MNHGKGNLKINKNILYAVNVLLLLLIVASDHFTKRLVILKLKDHPSVSLIPGILELSYLENSGAAFGMLKNQGAFFFLVTFILVLTIIYIIFKTPGKRKYIAGDLALIFIAGGAIGNLIDRLINNFVIDFIYFRAVNFPVFNVADIFVSLGTLMLIFLLLFYYKEDDLNFFRFKEKKIREI